MYIVHIQWQPCICGLMIFYLYSMIADILAVYNFYCVEVAVSLYPIRVFYSPVTYHKGLYYIPILSLRIVMYIHCKIYLYAIILLDHNDTKYWGTPLLYKYIEKMNIFRPSSYNSKIRSFILESFDPIPWYIEYSVNCALLNWKYVSFP